MARGEEAAAAVLFDRHGAAIYAAVLRTLGESAAAERLVVDTFARAWREASRFETRGGTVAEWLIAIARAVAREPLHARESRTTVTDAMPIAFVEPPVATPPPLLHEQLQARLAVEAGTQNAAQIAGDVASRVTTPTGTAALAAPVPPVPGALDEIRARINADQTSMRAMSGPEPPPAGPTVSRATPTSRAVRVTPRKGGLAVGGIGRHRAARAGWYLSALLAAALAAASFVALDLRTRVGALEIEARKASAQKTRAEQKLVEKERTLATLLAGRGNVVLVTLAGAAPTGPGMQVFWNVRDGKAVVNAFGLAQVATDRAYLLWMIRDGQAIPVKPFTPDDTGRALLVDVELPVTITGITQLVVTEESAQGAQAPTMTPILAGDVRGES